MLSTPSPISFIKVKVDKAGDLLNNTLFECENIWYFLMFISLVCLQMCKEFVSRKIEKLVCNKLIMKFIICRQVFSSMKDVSSNNFNEADFM